MYLSTKYTDAPIREQVPLDEAAPPERIEIAEINGLYLHIPFCFHKCHYCDFYSIVDDRGRQRVFTERLIEEAAAWGKRVSGGRASGGRGSGTIRTIFVGGGTPTLLHADLWRELLPALHDAFDLSALVEFTVEANPETVTADLLGVLAGGGVNRLSIGAQSFDPRQLKTLERWHDPANVTRAAQLARAAGIDNINLDLIFAVPGQSLGDWRGDLDRALSLSPSHLSCYGLMYEPNTPLTRRLDMGRIERCDDSLETAMYQTTLDTLTAAGFEHYEVSNFARLSPAPQAGPESPKVRVQSNIQHPKSKIPLPSFRCEHNLLYWRNENYLPLGPSASGHADGLRWKNVPHLGRYLASSGTPPIRDVERLDPDASIGEQLMLRLRLIEGVELDWLEPRLTPGSDRRRVIEDHLAAGLLERTATHLRLTPRGLMLADPVIAELL